MTLTDLLYPPKCPFCGRVLDSSEIFMCPGCARSLPRTLPGEEKQVPGCDGCAAPLWYRDGVVEAVHRYKFRGGQNHAALFSTLMADCLRTRWQQPLDAVTWAPLSRKRLAERGYDQAELLAAGLGRQLGLPVIRLLEKPRDIPPQSRLDRDAARRENVRGAYRLRAGADCTGLRLALADDVITSGATLSECAAVLAGAGAASIVAVSLAWAGE